MHVHVFYKFQHFQQNIWFRFEALWWRQWLSSFSYPPSPLGQDQEQPKTPTPCVDKLRRRHRYIPSKRLVRSARLVERTGLSRFASLLCQCVLSFNEHRHNTHTQYKITINLVTIFKYSPNRAIIRINWYA